VGNASGESASECGGRCACTPGERDALKQITVDSTFVNTTVDCPLGILLGQERETVCISDRRDVGGGQGVRKRRNGWPVKEEERPTSKDESFFHK
jgi:hypothetical protein